MKKKENKNPQIKAKSQMWPPVKKKKTNQQTNIMNQSKHKQRFPILGYSLT